MPTLNAPSIRLDYTLISLVTLLVLAGFSAVLSASSEFSQFHLQIAVKQGFYYLIAFWALLIVSLIPLAYWQRYGWILLFVGIGLLVAVLIPGVAREVKGAKRWISFGIMSLQVSELVKICVVIFMAGYLVRREDEVQARWSGFVKPLAVMVLVTVLLLLQPDFGAVVVMFSAVLAMLFVAGVRISQFMTMSVLMLAGGYLAITSAEYRVERLRAFMNPWADKYGDGYQLIQSLIAFGRGEVTGVGYGNSIQKLAYLPDAHTDFVIAIWAEEMGALGMFPIIALFLALVLYIIRLAFKAYQQQQLFAAYTAVGIACLLFAQVFINIGVNTGLLPTKGLTLPFFSYGGSSLLSVFASIALIGRISYELSLAENQGAKHDS